RTRTCTVGRVQSESESQSALRFQSYAPSKMKESSVAPTFCGFTSSPFASSRAAFTASDSLRTRSSIAFRVAAGIAPENLVVVQVPTQTSSMYISTWAGCSLVASYLTWLRGTFLVRCDFDGRDT